MAASLCVQRAELLPQSRSVFDDSKGKVRWAGTLPGLGRTHVASCPLGTTWDPPEAFVVVRLDAEGGDAQALSNALLKTHAAGELHKLQVRLSARLACGGAVVTLSDTPASFDCRHGPVCIRACLTDDALTAFPHSEDLPLPTLLVEWLRLDVQEGPPPTPSKM